MFSGPAECHTARPKRVSEIAKNTENRLRGIAPRNGNQVAILSGLFWLRSCVVSVLNAVRSVTLLREILLIQFIEPVGPLQLAACLARCRRPSTVAF